MENIQLLTFWMSRLRWSDSEKHQQRVKLKLEPGGSCPDKYNPIYSSLFFFCDTFDLILSDCPLDFVYLNLKCWDSLGKCSSSKFVDAINFTTVSQQNPTISIPVQLFWSRKL